MVGFKGTCIAALSGAVLAVMRSHQKTPGAQLGMLGGKDRE
jgi:hypothetical protein